MVFNLYSQTLSQSDAKFFVTLYSFRVLLSILFLYDEMRYLDWGHLRWKKKGLKR